MDALWIAGTLAGSFVGAFIIQKAALEGLLRVMATGRRSHSYGAAGRGGLFSRSALGVVQTRLPHFSFLSFWFADDERSATYVFGPESFVVCQSRPPWKSGI